MKHVLTLLVVLCLAGTVAYAETTDVMFSEYVEGSGFNKALELFNGTGDTVDLSAYSVEIYYNGATVPGETIPLSGMLAEDGLFVLAHTDADETILAVADQVSAQLGFNGNDAVTLVVGGSVVDSIGQVGFDPGSEWGSGAASTQDNTLRRNADVCDGDVDPADTYDPAAEWTGFAMDTFDGLGGHESDCGTSELDEVTWSSLKFGYR